MIAHRLQEKQKASVKSYLFKIKLSLLKEGESN